MTIRIKNWYIRQYVIMSFIQTCWLAEGFSKCANEVVGAKCTDDTILRLDL